MRINNKETMKYRGLFFLVLLMGVLPNRLMAQEYIYQPLDGYYYNHWISDYYPSNEAFINGYTAGLETLVYGFFKRFVTEDTLPVYGVAFSAVVDTGFNGPSVHQTTSIPYIIEYTDFDSSYLRVQVRQYDGGEMTLAAETQAAPMNIPVVGYLKGQGNHSLPKYPIQEVFFSGEVPMTDTFYVGFFASCPLNLTPQLTDSGLVIPMHTWPIGYSIISDPDAYNTDSQHCVLKISDDGGWGFLAYEQVCDWYIFPIISKGGHPPVGIEEVAEPLKALVTPNPAGTIAGISASQPIERLEVYNLAGEKVYESQPGYIIATLDVSRWPSGLYVLKIHSTHETITKKLTVTH